MRDFNNNRFSGGNRFDRRGSDRSGGFGNRGGGDRQMFPAVCDNCGKDCEVPFRPSNDKPVYCNDCFKKMNDREDGRGFERRDNFRQENKAGSNDMRQQLDSINARLNQIIKLLENKEDKKSSKEKKAVKEEAVIVTEVEAKPKAKTKKTSTKKKKKSE